MLSGASSSAPRWSVVGLIGNATRLLAGEQLAPAAGGDGRDDGEQQEAGHAVGISRSMSKARPRRAGTGERRHDRARERDQPTNADARRQRRAAAARRTRCRRRGRAGGGRTSASRATRRRVSRGERGRHGPPPRRPSRRRRRSRRASRRAAPARVVQAWTASSRRWVETRTQAPRARASAITSKVASTPIGSTPSNGSSSSSTCGWCMAASTTESRRPMPWEKPPVTRCATSPSSKRSSRSRRAVLPVVEPAQPGGELEVLPGRGPRHQAADVGAVARDLLDREGVRADVEAGHGHACPRSAGPRRRARAWWWTCRRRCGRAGRSPAPAYARRSMPATASTSPNRTCRPRTSTTGEVPSQSLTRPILADQGRFHRRTGMGGWNPVCSSRVVLL